MFTTLQDLSYSNRASVKQKMIISHRFESNENLLIQLSPSPSVHCNSLFVLMIVMSLCCCNW